MPGVIPDLACCHVHAEHAGFDPALHFFDIECVVAVEKIRRPYDHHRTEAPEALSQKLVHHGSVLDFRLKREI